MQPRRPMPWSQFPGRPMASWSWIRTSQSRHMWASCPSLETGTNWDTAWLEETLASNITAFCHRFVVVSGWRVFTLQFMLCHAFFLNSAKADQRFSPYWGLPYWRILWMFCIRFKDMLALSLCFLPVCGVWVLQNIHISTPLFTGWRIPRCSQGALYLLLSDMVIQLFRNKTPFFLPRCLG